jgi:WD40 repeat protein/serine/threonine protein kinase
MSPSESHSALVLELAEEFLERYRQGQRPSLKEYIDRHPELAAEIKEVFPAMALMENVALADESLVGGVTGPSTAPASAAPQQLGDFRILREVGRGGMGIVYEAEQVSLGRHVALKVLPRKMLVDATQKRRFEREAKAAARLHHTNIVPVFGVGEHEGLPYYVMQFIQGLGLDEVLDELKRLQGSGNLTAAGDGLRVARKDVSAVDVARSLLTGAFHGSSDLAATAAPGAEALGSPDVSAASKLSDSFTLSSSSVTLPASRIKGKKATYWQSVAQIGMQVADALEYAHKQGILHRDIKPSNLLLDTRGTVWVADFGLARAETEDHLTHTGDIVGTLRYMPPEAFEGRTDKRSDLYSLGLAMYELLALRPAFEDKDRHKLIKRVTTEEPPRLDRLNRAIPRDLVTIVHKVIDREPLRRYLTAGELAADLQRFVEDEPIKARRVSVTERAGRWCRHNPALAGLTAALVLVFLAGFLGVAWKWRDAEWQKDVAQAAERGEAEQRAIAVEQADRATREAERSRRLLYAADMSLAQQAWEAGDTGRARALLERQRPPAGQEEFEWRYLWRLCQDGSRQTLRGHNREITGLTLTKDGRTLATCGLDQSVCIWDMALRRHVKLLQRDITSATLAPDGKLLALSPGLSQTVQLWDPIARRVVASLPAQARVVRVAFSPDGSLLAAGCANGTIRLWDVPTRRELQLGRAPQPIAPVRYIAFSPDGRTLASAGVDGTVQLWDIAARRVRASFQGHSAAILSLSFSPDGKTLASASADTTVRFWDTATGQPMPPPIRGPRTVVNAVSFAPDGKTLATGGEDGTIRIWDAATKTALILLRGHAGPITTVAFAPDGRSLFSGSWDGTLKVWNVAPGSGSSILSRSKGEINSVAFSPDGKTLAVSDQDNSVKLWNLASRKLVYRLTGHAAPVYRVAYAPDGRTLASTAFDKTLRLWDVATGKQVAEFPHKGIIESCAFSPDGKLIAAAMWGSEEVLVWEIAGRHPVTKLSGSHVQFSPDGALLAACLGNTVQLWDAATWQGLPPLTGFTARVHCLAFAPNGKSLATCEQNGTVRLWDMVGKRQVASRRGHTSTIESVAFTPNGRRLATAGGDSTVKLWDVALLQEVATLIGHDGPVLAVAFSPDGNTLASASADATVRLWQAPLEETPREPAEAPGASLPAEVIHLFALEVHDRARATLTTPENTQRVDVTAIGDVNWNVELVQVFDDFQEGATYTIHFRAKADAPRRIVVYGQIAIPDWHPIGLTQDVGLTEKWQSYECQFRSKDLAAVNKIAFILGEQTGTVWIADFTLTPSAK